MTQRRYYLITPLAYTGKAASFTYHHDAPLSPGQIVEISIGRRTSTGVVEAEAQKPAFNTKPVSKVLDLPPLPEELHTFGRWISSYYASSPASVWNTMLPSGIGKQRRATTTTPPLKAAGPPSQALTAEQASALEQIRQSSKTTHLIQGVTGSGKTRLYLELAAESLTLGRSVILLVPEITLTPQVVGQFETAFGPKVLASHSKLTESQRHRIWSEAMGAAIAGEPRVIIGPRSCLFMPVHQLGLIMIDECHETSYKQEQHPRYNAITAAAWRARNTGSRLILGSATPGLTELHLAQTGRIEHIKLTKRTNEIPHSEGKIIDLRNKDDLRVSKFIAQPLLDAIADTLAQDRQTLLYINRRGSASSQVCGDCGYVNICPNCQLPLTFHADLMRLICHHCNYRIASPAVCIQCHGANLRLLGGGTKRIEAEIARLFPEARLARLDRDSATLSHIQAVFRDLKAGAVDIVIGTQMIAKGLDLPAIDTVGIVSADTMLHLPDYTAAERTYQLLSQVSGRAGRGDRPGRVFIQTYTPDHPTIMAAATGAYDRFASGELAERQAMHYPPFTFLLKLTVAAKTRNSAISEAASFAQTLRNLPGITVTGPAPAFIETINQKFHWVITVKSPRRPVLADIAGNVPGDHWTADLDPANLL